MDHLSFYKELYYKEIDRATTISNSFAASIGVISALAAGLYYVITWFFHADKLALGLASEISCIVIMGLAVFFLAKSIYHFSKGIANFKTGYSYAYLASSDDLYNYQKDLKEYYLDKQTEDTSACDFEEYIVNELTKCTTINQKINEIRLYQRFLGIRYMIFAFVALCFIVLPLGMQKQKEPDSKNSIIINR